MIDPGKLFQSIYQACDPSDVEIVLRRMGVTHMFWQAWGPEMLYTWDRVPPGFFSLYYGLDSDRHCALANASRAGWICFTFDQARDAFGKDQDACDAATIWTNFGMPDGVCTVHGYGDRRCVLVTAVEKGLGGKLIADYQPLLAAAAARLDMLLRDKLDTLYKASRLRGLLSPTEVATIRAQIDFPHFTARQQADYLKVSPRTLQSRHANIARKLGVSTFPGAIVVALRQKELHAGTAPNPPEAGEGTGSLNPSVSAR